MPSFVTMLTSPIHDCSARRVESTSGARFSGIAGNTRQDYSATFQRNRPLEGDLPEVLVESHDDPAFRFGALEERAIFETGTIGPCPDNVVIPIT